MLSSFPIVIHSFLHEKDNKMNQMPPKAQPWKLLLVIVLAQQAKMPPNGKCLGASPQLCPYLG